ncbi:hypothetical protein DH2020_032856 [Rehmannia glutinosa]|uniref:Uncharacterized protein n=1 Tax=Rehmannia glutinosa TaxID=99300 RepID=A0ABR0VHC0_REHGL
MDEAAAVDGASGPLHFRAHHIKKRALKNKSLSVSFNEKDLNLPKNKAEESLEVVASRKLERDFVQFGGAPPDSSADAVAPDVEYEHDEDSEPAVASVSVPIIIPLPSFFLSALAFLLTKEFDRYDNGDIEVTVRTSEIAREEEAPIDRSELGETQSGEAFEKNKQKTPVTRKKLLKKVQKKRARAKPQTKREKRKGKKKSNKQ